MSLDQNLFTLFIAPNAEDPTVVDLADQNGTLHYRKRRFPGDLYRIDVYDPLSESLLATATAPSASSKHKVIQLHNPDTVVELKYTGTLSFKWSFTWETHEFDWKREQCFLVRKPDPAVLVAVTKEPPARLRSTSVQMLDYNLNRFDVHDRKGLEIVILTALLTFHDANEAAHAPPPEATPGAAPSVSKLLGMGRTRTASAGAMSSSVPTGEAGMLAAIAAEEEIPALPPKPAPKTGLERIEEMHMIRGLQGEGEANEVHVADEGPIEDYASFAAKLLKDEAMLFITIRSASAAQVPKVLRVVEETKRLRYKEGLDEEQELHQYVVYDTAPERKGPRRINLDDPAPRQVKAYAPPTSLVVHLSKIDMPEMEPKEAKVMPSIGILSAAWDKGVDEGVGRGRVADKGKGKGKEVDKGKGKEKETVKTPEKEKPLSAKELKRVEKEREKAEKERNRFDKAEKDHKQVNSPPGPPRPSRPQGNLLTKPSNTTPRRPSSANPFGSDSLSAPPPYPRSGGHSPAFLPRPVSSYHAPQGSAPAGFAQPPAAPRPQRPSTGLLDWR